VQLLNSDGFPAKAFDHLGRHAYAAIEHLQSDLTLERNLLRQVGDGHAGAAQFAPDFKVAKEADLGVSRHQVAFAIPGGSSYALRFRLSSSRISFMPSAIQT
jgi:hypothetical protein